ncbi:hypothetical protein [Anaerospora sp.]|uniref:hypothetical protein n=1 Tax=Anaerospora sp. TaxID=1960278 RepID=UPI0028A01C73|nr:hypothetical protein [Anaerospora sp.]
MEIMNLARMEMSLKGIQVQELARQVRVAANTVSTWFGRGEIPEAMLGAVVEAIDSPRLSETRCSQCKGNAFPTRYLDNVDAHPMVAINKASREIKEWTDLVGSAIDTITNRPKGVIFSEQEEQLLIRFENETADLITSMKTVLIRFQECYNRPVVATMNRHVAKLEQSGYCSVTKKKAAPYKQSC